MVVGCSRPDYCHEKNVHLTLVSLIKVEGLFSPYIVVIFDIVNSESLVQRYIYLKHSLDEINQFS